MSDGSDLSNNIAAAALAVSLVALLTTLSQVLQQYSATADGYRRCQASVMGRFASRTRLRWRWSEFRFETLFTTPVIELHDLREMYQSKAAAYGVHLITGSPDSLQHTLSLRWDAPDAPEDLATWVPFLAAVHHVHQKVFWMLLVRGDGEPVDSIWDLGSRNAEKFLLPHERTSDLTLPGLKFREKSWDFMPADVLRPYATITVHDVAVIARRMGMSWREFNPSEGSLRAEGNGYIITSTSVRSVGTMLRFALTGRNDRQFLPAPSRPVPDEMYIPSSKADAMGFGIIPGCAELGIPDLKVGTDQEILKLLVTRCGVGDHLQKLDDQWMLGFADILGIACQMVRRSDTSLMRVPSPMAQPYGIIYHWGAFVTFHHRLTHAVQFRDRHYLEESPMQQVLDWYNVLRETYPEWEDPAVADSNVLARKFHFTSQVKAYWDKTTEYFLDLEEKYQSKDNRFRYYDLMCCHLKQVIDVTAAIMRSRTTRDMTDSPNEFSRLGMRIYTSEYLTAVIEAMAQRGFHDRAVIADAWWTMIFRAMCWHRCHYLVEGPRVGSEYYGSQLPIYIG